MSFLTQALAFITRPEGSAIYHILTLFALEAAFGIALSHRWRNGAASGATRLAIAAGLAGAFRAVLLILGPLGENGLIPAPAIIAPLDRAVAVATLLLIAWAVVIRPGNRWADLLLGLAMVAVMVTYVVLAILWYPVGAQGAYYNNTLYEAIWELAKLSIVLITLLALLFFRPPDWGLALGMFLILLGGVAFHLTFPTIPLEAENFPAAQRLAEMAAFPLLAVIVYRLALGSPPVATASREVATEAFSALPKVKLTPQAASALAYIAVGSDENDFSKRVAEAISRTLLADYTLIFAQPVSEETVNCACAYDLIREKHLPGFSLPARSVSTIASAIARGRPARLRWDAHKQELEQLAQSLGIQQYGSAILAPLIDEDEAGNTQSLGAIVIMAAYTQKEWSNDDHNLLSSIAKPLSRAFLNFNTTNRNTNDLLTDLDNALRRAEIAEAATYSAEERASRFMLELEQIRDENRRNQQQIESLTAIIQAEPTGVAATALATATAAKAADGETDDIAEPPAFMSDDEFAALQANYRRALEELAEVNEELSKVRSAFDELKQDSSTAESGYTETIASLNEQLASKQSTIEQFRQESTNAVVEYTNEINELKTKLEEAQTKAAPAESPVTTIVASAVAGGVATLSADAAALEAARAERDRIIKELSDTRNELMYARQLLSNAPTDEDLIQARAEVEQLTKDVKRLQDELEAKPAATAAPAAANGTSAPPNLAELAELEEQLSEAYAEIVSLRGQLQSVPADVPSILRSHSEMLLSLIQDLRQPLSSVTGYSDLLLGESVGIISTLQRNFIERVKASAERMSNTIDDLVSVTAIDAGTLKLEEQNFDITDVIEDAFTSVGAQFREKSISLRMDIADDIPPIAADRDAILQIISRLLNNACTASEPNSEVILTALPQNDNTMLVTVRDTGGGVAERDIPRVFARFYRADRPLIQGLGDTGAGLSVAKALTEAQGGRIWVESQTGTGSTFNVILPTNGHH